MVESPHRHDFEVLLDLLYEAVKVDLWNFQCFLKFLQYLIDLEVLFGIEFMKLVFSACIVSFNDDVF